MISKVLIGNQIGKKLIEGLGLPKNTVSFELRCAVDEIVTVKCEYFPEGSDAIETLINDYRLIAVGGTVGRESKQPAPIHFDTWYRAKRDAAHAAYMKGHEDLGLIDAKVEIRIAVQDVASKVIREAVKHFVQGGIIGSKAVGLA
jgi:hypothetical protein